ncbi:TPA_asm: UL53 uORF [Human alphaherpesvirus 1]|nr:TPA_asm: UL53 uORF [Human alphaherpesvirus 1]
MRGGPSRGSHRNCWGG